ncbi:SEC-C metal-binding domain-containing protein [Paenibacillus sp. A14]|uniref:SEC-C metal-binding domain-containing protein n=1 Tax=Paenibacillus sp. A14 TaxID=3119820 RepID=UPI002FE0A733
MDFNQVMEENNIRHAIVGEMQTSLSDILGGLTKTRLAALARTYSIPGRSKMKQNELIQAVHEALVDIDRLESTLLLLDAEEWELFASAVDHKSKQDNYVPYGYYAFLLDRGLLFTYFHEGELHLVIPEEVRAAYARLNTAEFRDARDRRARVYQYLLAMTHLYGAFQPEKLVEIFNDQNADELTLEEFQTHLEHILQREREFILQDGWLVDAGLAHSGEEGELESLLERIQGKPYYVPDQAELLRYADDGYFEMTPQLKALKDFVVGNMGLDEEMAHYLVDDIQLACSMEAPMQQMIYEFDRRELVFDDEVQVRQVAQLLVDVSNHTRLWSNCGHTPAELGTGKPTTIPTVMGRTSKTPIRVVKVGRNDPCPCGSGKKYKKCCGQ